MKGQRYETEIERDRYTEYADGTGTIGMVYDTENDDAWIRSDRTVSIGESTTTGIQDETSFDAETGAYRVPFDCQEGEQLSMAIVTAVADIADVDPTDMEPLYDQIDPESLDRLFDTPVSDVGVSFTFHGHEVTVKQHGYIVVQPLDSR